MDALRVNLIRMMGRDEEVSRPRECGWFVEGTVRVHGQGMGGVLSRAEKLGTWSAYLAGKGVAILLGE